MIIFGITRRQRDTLTFITTYIENHNGVSPSFQEIGEAIGLRSKSGVNRIIKKMAERGAIKYLPGRTRSIRIATKEDNITEKLEVATDALKKIAREYGVSVAGAIAATALGKINYQL